MVHLLHILTTAVRYGLLKTQRQFKKYPNFNFAEGGAEDASKRPKTKGTLDRANGSGRLFTARTEDAVSSARNLVEEHPDKSVGELMRETGLKRTTTQNILKEDLGLKCFIKVKTQRVKFANAGKRMELCLK